MLDNAFRWMYDNSNTIAVICFVIAYLVRTIMPRMPPSSPFWLTMWKLENCLLILPWDRWFGTPKLPFKIVPNLVSLDPREAPTHRDIPSLPPKDRSDGKR